MCRPLKLYHPSRVQKIVISIKKKGNASLLMLQEDQEKLLLMCTSSLSSVQYEISCLTKQRAPKNNTNKKKHGEFCSSQLLFEEKQNMASIDVSAGL